MPFTPLPGKSASISIGGSTMNFSKVSFPMEVKLPEVSNWSSLARLFVAGLYNVKFQVEGPWDSGSMGIALGTTYTVVITWGTAVTTSVSAICEKIEIDQDVDDAARLKITFQSNGTFTASIA
jgi:hypothetical protein